MAETPGKITLWGIEVFIATAQEGAISAAARRLGASPSAVSQQLSNLEAAIGATLLDRSARPATLTAAGEIFLRRAQSILNEATLARAELAGADLSALTRFRLGMIEDFDAEVTPRLLVEMAEDLTRCQFLLETGASHRLFELLDMRALDVVVAADTGFRADWAEVHPLMQEPFVAAVPQGRIDPARPLLPQIGDLPFIHYTERHHMGRRIAAHLAEHDLRLSHRFQLDSYHAIMAMVADGRGWSILTPLGYLAARRFHERVALMPLPVAPLARTITLTARRDMLHDLPAAMVARMKPLLDERVVAPALAQYPWLGKSLGLL